MRRGIVMGGVAVVVAAVWFGGPPVVHGGEAASGHATHKRSHRRPKVAPWEYDDAYLLSLKQNEAATGVDIEAFIPMKNLTDAMVDAIASCRVVVRDPSGRRHTWHHRQAVTAGIHLRYPRDFLPQTTWPTQGRHRLIITVDGEQVWDATFELAGHRFDWWQTGKPREW